MAASGKEKQTSGGESGDKAFLQAGRIKNSVGTDICLGEKLFLLFDPET